MRDGDWRGDDWIAANFRPAISLPINALAANSELFQGRCVLIGWSVHATGGAAGRFAIIDGMDATGPVVADNNMPIGGSTLAGPGSPGVRMEQGVYVVISGAASMTGAVWVQPVDYAHRPGMPLMADGDQDRDNGNRSAEVPGYGTG